MKNRGLSGDRWLREARAQEGKKANRQGNHQRDGEYEDGLSAGELDVLGRMLGPEEGAHDQPPPDENISFICIMGIKIAKTRKATAAPIARIMMGSKVLAS